VDSASCCRLGTPSQYAGAAARLSPTVRLPVETLPGPGSVVGVPDESRRVVARERRAVAIAQVWVARPSAYPRVTAPAAQADCVYPPHSGAYAHEIVRRGDQSLYTVTDGANTISEPILYHSAREKLARPMSSVTTVRSTKVDLATTKTFRAWMVTMGYPGEVPPSLDVAAGRRISMDEARNCFSCHSTGAVYGNQLELESHDARSIM